MHLHRVTRDVQADRSSRAVRFPLRDIAVGVARRDEAIVVSAVTAAFATAVARYVPENLGMFGGEQIRGADDIGRTRGHRIVRKWREAVLFMGSELRICRRLFDDRLWRDGGRLRIGRGLRRPHRHENTGTGRDHDHGHDEKR